MRKLSCVRPSTNLPRSSRTVVWSTTRLTFSLMRLPVCPLPESWSGGGGGGIVCTGICARDGPAKKSRVSDKARPAKNIERGIRRSSVRRRVVTGPGVNGKRRKALGWGQFDLDFAPPGVMDVVAWPVSQNILISQLHADLGRNVRKII